MEGPPNASEDDEKQVPTSKYPTKKGLRPLSLRPASASAVAARPAPTALAPISPPALFLPTPPSGISETAAYWPKRGAEF